ncbi:MAG: ABC transporter permease [Deltaproteobacteria bacterium]|nr:ABC transporter permease [Deltaproteobacteria bacterium]
MAASHPTSTAATPCAPGPVGSRWYELVLTGRLLNSRRSAHLSLVTALSVAGIALGVAALIVVLAVNTGFQVAFQDRILASYPHLVVMQRGVDLRDWRPVVDKLARVPDVRSASPATYDDMMLSAAQGRAGAIVRGVGPQALANLPAGAVVQGKVEATGEAPTVQVRDGALWVDRGVAGARHLAIVVGEAVHVLAVLATGSSLGGLVVFDATACGKAVAAPAGTVWLKAPELAEPMRSGPRRPCGLVGTWEALPGRYIVRWTDGNRQFDRELTVDAGRTGAVVVHGDTATLVPAPPAELGAMAAAVAAVRAEGGPMAVRAVVHGKSQEIAAFEMWHPFAGQLPAMVVGEGLAARLRVQVGDEVRAVSPLRGLDRSSEGSDSSASGRFRIAAVVRTGFHDHDQRLALVDFVAAQRFLGRGDIARWVEVRVQDPILAAAQSQRYAAALDPADLGELLASANALQAKLAGAPSAAATPRDTVAAVDSWAGGVRTARELRLRGHGQYRVIDWQEMNRNIFDAARMQKVAMSLFPFIIVLVAALNVVGTQAVVVHERAREIAILRAMGAARRSVAAMFLLQGLVVGILGTAIGLALGGLTCWLLDTVGYPLDPQVYLISRLPVHAEPATFGLAAAAAVALAFVAAWLAAQRAAGRPPVDALRRLD